MNTMDPRYPIGRYQRPEKITEQDLTQWISDISSFPDRLRKVVSEMNEEKLNTTYREGGWTARQVVHHCADSHMNAFVRFKLALTEDNPSIKPYLEAEWAKLPDAKKLPVESSLQILDGLHHRWALLLQSLSMDDLSRTFFHPESGREIRLDHTLALYAWHCNHHLGHVLLVA